MVWFSKRKKKNFVASTSRYCIFFLVIGVCPPSIRFKSSLNSIRSATNYSETRRNMAIIWHTKASRSILPTVNEAAISLRWLWLRSRGSLNIKFWPTFAACWVLWSSVCVSFRTVTSVASVRVSTQAGKCAHWTLAFVLVYMKKKNLEVKRVPMKCMLFKWNVLAFRILFYFVLTVNVSNF